MNSRSFEYLTYLQLSLSDIVIWTKDGKLCLDYAHNGQHYRAEAGNIDDVIFNLIKQAHPDVIPKIDAQDLLEMLFGDCILPKANAWLNAHFEYYKVADSDTYKNKWCKIRDAYEILMGYKWVYQNDHN